ncbi:MAG: alpha/beta hydrolase [Myxococcota bacterium]|nr:alpha/beta hydrolase [Myxococcota bacterium]
MTPRSRRISGSDGLDLHLLEWSTEGVALLLVHGFGNDAHIWDDFSPTVAPYYRVLALDQRGHGDSAWALHGEYEYEHFVADLECVCESLAIDRFVLVGHSLGGRVAMLYGGEHPEKLAGLVIVDSAPEIDARGSTRIQMEVGQHRDPSFENVAEYEGLLLHNYPAAQPEAIRRMARSNLKQRSDGRWILKMDPALRGAVGGMPSAEERANREEQNTAAMWKALEKIPCPTLVVRGAASDIISPEIADRMADEVLPKGQLAVVGRAGHSVMTDNPDGFRDAVLQFVVGEE